MSDPHPTCHPVPPHGALLSRTTLMLLRRVLHAYREGWVLDDGLARAAGAVAEDAHRLGVPAEAMLVALKQRWRTLDEVHGLAAHEGHALLARLVTLAIQAYYGADGAGPEPADPRRPEGGCPELAPGAAVHEGASVAA